MSKWEKARYSSCLRFIGVYRECFVAAPARMCDVIRASSDRPLRSGIHHIEDERRVYRDCGVETAGRLPRTVSHSADEVAIRSGRLQGQRITITCDCHSLAREPFDPNLHPFDGRIHVTGRTARARLFAKDIPGFDCLPELHFNTVVTYSTIHGKTKFEMRRKPGFIDGITRPPQIVDDGGKILFDVVRKKKEIVKAGSPTDRFFLKWGAPEPRNQSTYKQLLRQTHPCMRRHLERPHLHKTEPARRAVGRVELIDAEFGTMRVAGHVDQQVSENPVDQPRRTIAGS